MRVVDRPECVGLREIVWLAGLLEGEGSFTVPNGSSPRIDLTMTDQDVVERAAWLLGGRVTTRTRLERNKLQYVTVVYGQRAVSWMMTLWSFMGQRRQARITAILGKWLERPKRGIKGVECHNGHPRDIENSYIDPTGKAYCRSCRRVSDHKRGEAKRNARSGQSELL